MRTVLSILTIFTLVLTGCTNQSKQEPPSNLVSYREMNKTDFKTVTAPRSTYYGLFRTGHDHMIARFPVKAGEKIGFAEHPLKATVNMTPGRIYAIAGDYDFSLDPGNYDWREVPGTTIQEMTPIP